MFRRNKSTIIKCLIIALVVVITVPLLLRTSLLEPDNVETADGPGKTPKLRESVADAADNVLKPSVGPRKGGASADEALRLMDWHDRDAVSREKERSGPGEGGSAYILTAEEEKLKSPLYQGKV